MSRPSHRGLTVRDLVTIGIFSAVVFIISIASGMVTAIHPDVYVFDPVVLALLGAIFFLLIAVRTHKTGAFFLMCAIFGIIWAVLGGWTVLVAMLAAGVIGEFLVSRTRYRSITALGAAWTLFALANFVGIFALAWIAPSSYLASGEKTGQSSAYAQGILDVLDGPLVWVSLGATVVSAIVGIGVSRLILAKHFGPEAR